MSKNSAKIRMRNSTVCNAINGLAIKLEKMAKELRELHDDTREVCLGDDHTDYDKMVQLAHAAEKLVEISTTHLSHNGHLRLAVTCAAEAEMIDFYETYKDKIEG